MFVDLKHRLSNIIYNIPGWRTKRHIVVIESDDWGAIRMPSREVYEILIQAGYSVDNNKFEKYDSIATEEDLTALFEVLYKFRDKNGNHPVITANCVVTNPDFEKIKATEFREYHYESIVDTMSHYKGCYHSYDIWKEGIKNGVFYPQFHGREHINVTKWMRSLQQQDSDTRFAFDLGMAGLAPKTDKKAINYYVVALDDIQIKESLIDGLHLFEQLFGYKSKTFIAPCYTWSPQIEQPLFEYGVVGIQGAVYQINPQGAKIRHWQGTRNKYNQIYTVRNCFFEPTYDPQTDYVNDCINRIRCAFTWHKPAVISAHRLNFINSIQTDNTPRTLKLLNDLLKRILKIWPDVEFMTSDQLVDIIRKRDEKHTENSL